MLVRIIHGDSELSLDIDPGWNVLFVKQRACQMLQLSFDEYDLLLNHRRLEEDGRFTQYQLNDGKEVNLVLARREIRNRFFIYCYSCDSVTPALLSFICETCGKPQFRTTSISENRSNATGNCCDNTCPSTRGRVKFLCLKMPSHEPAVLLDQLRRNLELVPCVACFNEDRDILVRFCDVQNHALCIDCFKAYAQEYLESGLFQLVPEFGFTLGCPAGCRNAFITDPHHFRILGSEFYSRYKEFSASRYICANDSVVCPHCGQIWETSVEPQMAGRARASQESRPRLYTCRAPAGCGSLFCALCNWFYTGAPNEPPACYCEATSSTRSPLRLPEVLRFVPAWHALPGSSAGEAAHNILVKTCRPCPKCKSPTEKSGGCNHMHCSVCSTDWCWICCEEWTSDCQALHWL
ncbi:hypothetical protein CRM22_001383 [Opisthorchis felineus]|uniref:RBR-type E3 ubiquitin transferase n=1 Tax=Opisthorchis felineus TaxID=147828 RepID=A0A4S2MGV3_OPIFE|nr:hypothetical protein CRM22_001383 [Opisthorchis felineus]